MIALVTLAVLPAAAGATSRFASPTPSGTMDCSSSANACDLPTAILSASSNDDIFVPGDLGDYALNGDIHPTVAPLHIHGTNGRPRLLFSIGTLHVKGPSTVENLYIQAPGTAFGLDPPGGSSADGIIVKVTDDGHACYLSGGQTLSNSVCWAVTAGDLAVETDGSNTFHNDTLVGGTEAAIRAIGRNSGCACSAATDTLINVIARSRPTGHDIDVSSDGTADMTVDAEHSNFATSTMSDVGAPAKTHLVTDATDQSDAPLFVDAAHGDFHQALGSPTIDAGVDDVANGTTDFDGDPRVIDGTTDIGADELVVGPTPTPRPSPATLDHFFSYQAKATKGQPTFLPIGPVMLADQFATRNYDVIKATALLLPADKDGGGVQDDVTHLLGYALKASKGDAKFVVPPDVHVLNQCSDVALVAKKPLRLLVPTAKSLQGTPTAPTQADDELDHFLCYAAKARTKPPKGTQVTVADQFQTRRYDLKKITTLCVPVAKSGNPFVLKGPSKGTAATITTSTIRHPEALLVCYQAKLAGKVIPQLGCGAADPKAKGTKIDPKQLKHAAAGVFVANQLGALRLDAGKELELCVPSLAP